MILKPVWHKTIQVIFIIGTILGILILGRIAFVMGMTHYINSKAEEGTHDPAELYYLIQSYTGDFMEPYKAYYNAGTAYANNEDYERAELFLSESLARVDYVYNECLIRNNLAYSYEKQGDYYVASEMPDIAETYYGKAVTTVQEAPPVCFPPSNGGSGGEKEGESENGPLPDQTAEPSDSATGENMEKTEASSDAKGDKIREADGDSTDGKEQVEQENNQSTGETGNREDQTAQEKNSETSPEQVEKPW